MEFMTNLQNGLDELKPSLFELLSEQQLSALVPPSLRYILAITTHRHPRYLLRALNSFDELYALISLVVERHFLRTYGGSFTENFYGLKRERVLRVRGGEVPRAQLGAPGQVRESLRLRRWDVWKNLAVIVGLPYLKRKLDEGYDIHAAGLNALGPGFRTRRDEQLRPNAGVRERLRFYYKWFLRNVYPSLNAAYYFSILIFNLAYLFDTSKFHNPFLWLVSTRMRRLGAADHNAIAIATQPKSTRSAARPGEGGSAFSPRNVARGLQSRTLYSLRLVLPASILALKFLEWWHASDFARQLSKKASEGLDLPPPVISGLSRPWASATERKKLSDDERSAQQAKGKASPANEELSDTKGKGPPFPTTPPPIASSTLLPILTVPFPVVTDDGALDSSLCPICRSAIVTPTAAATGYVFCYTCIHRWVEGEHERQSAFIEGGGGDAGWGAEEGSRAGRWESGKGRCPVTGRKLLGGTDGLRRLVA